MDYYLTKHARDAVQKREIMLAWLEKALIVPEWIEQDSIDEELEHRLARISEFDNRILRVIVNKTVVPLRVVTVYFDRRRTKNEIENR